MTGMKPVICGALPIYYAGTKVIATKIPGECGVVGLTGGDGYTAPESVRRGVISIDNTAREIPAAGKSIGGAVISGTVGQP